MEIDVSKCVDIYQCETFNHCISQSKLATNSNCNANKDCYYKQLQQLKQEKEDLRNKLKQINIEAFHKTFRSEIFDELRQENEELSKKIKAITDTSYELSIKNLQLEQKLEKIKDKAEYWQDRWINDSDEVQGFDEILKIIEEK